MTHRAARRLAHVLAALVLLAALVAVGSTTGPARPAPPTLTTTVPGTGIATAVPLPQVVRW